MKTEMITDHELSMIADDWAKEIPYENIGIRTAFAAGYRLAEQQANGVESKDGKLPIPHVSGSLPLDKVDELLKMQIEECRYFAQRCARDYGACSADYDKWIAETPVITLHRQ